MLHTGSPGPHVTAAPLAGALTHEIALGLVGLCPRTYGSDVGGVGACRPAEDKWLDVGWQIGEGQELSQRLQHTISQHLWYSRAQEQSTGFLL